MDGFRALMLLGQAQSALAQCCELLGEDVCNEMLREVDRAMKKVTDQIEAMAVEN